MPLTGLTLTFLAAVALLATIASFMDTVDEYVTLLVPWVAAVLWGNVALASFSVQTQSGDVVTMLPMAWIAAGAAMLMTIVGVYELVVRPGKETARADLDLTGGRS
jgi:hypothetical protein